jgi:hypothetical protein
MNKMCVDAILIVDCHFVQTPFLDLIMNSARSYGDISQPSCAPYPVNLNAGAHPTCVYLSTQPGASAISLQQPATVINLANPQPVPVVVQSPTVESYVIHTVFSCVVLWCCNPLCGLIAFILASK